MEGEGERKYTDTLGNMLEHTHRIDKEKREAMWTKSLGAPVLH